MAFDNENETEFVDLTKMGEKFKSAFNKRFGKSPIVKFLLVVLGLILLFSSFYTIGADQEGIILRFGRYIDTVSPGLHLRLPFGIDKVYKEKVKEIKKQEFGFRTVRAGVTTQYARSRRLDAESLMLTGDLNSAVVEWVVRYKIKNLKDYFFNLRDVHDTIRDVSEAAMRLIVGDRSVDEVLTVGRGEVALETQKEISRRLDEYKAGIHVVAIKLKEVTPPDPVKDAFNAVNEARQKKDAIINRAEEKRNSVIPAAHGERQKMIEEAKGYRIKRINEAKGEAEEFLAVLREYRTARDVTRRRLYLETMNEILPKVGEKYIIQGETSGLLKLLNITQPGIEEPQKKENEEEKK